MHGVCITTDKNLKTFGKVFGLRASWPDGSNFHNVLCTPNLGAWSQCIIKSLSNRT